MHRMREGNTENDSTLSADATFHTGWSTPELAGMANDAMRKIHSPLIFAALMMGHGWPSTK
jgi:hypothetical protein